MLGLCSVWASAALYFDARPSVARIPAALVYLTLVAGAFLALHTFWLAALVDSAAFGGVLLWWLAIKPSNQRVWQTDVAQSPWAEIDGDRVTIHNYRRCEYRSEFDYTCQWESKVVQLSEIRGLELDCPPDYQLSDWRPRPRSLFHRYPQGKARTLLRDPGILSRL